MYLFGTRIVCSETTSHTSDQLCGVGLHPFLREHTEFYGHDSAGVNCGDHVFCGKTPCQTAKIQSGTALWSCLPVAKRRTHGVYFVCTTMEPASIG